MRSIRWFAACFCFTCTMANGFLSFSQEKTFTGPVVKNGRFYFYNPSFRRDTVRASTKPTQKREPCYCGIKKPESRMSFVSSGQLILYIISTDATCGYGSGSIIVQVTNGTAPYIYTDTYYGFTGPPQNTGNFPSEGAGSHTITVMDANGTNASAIVVINNILPGPVVVPAFVTKSPSDCFKADGEVTLQPNGGTPPYTYSLD